MVRKSISFGMMADAGGENRLHQEDQKNGQDHAGKDIREIVHLEIYP